MVAKPSLIFITIVGTEGPLPAPVFIIGKQERRSKYPVALGDDVHGRLTVEKVSGNDYMIQLIPFALIFMRARKLYLARIGKEIVKPGWPDSARYSSGGQHLRDTCLFGRIIEIAHNEKLRRAADGQQRIAKPPKRTGGVCTIRLALHLATIARREVAHEDIERIGSSYLSADMKDIACMLMLLAAEDYRIFRVADISELIVPVEKRRVDAPCVGTMRHAIPIMLLL